MSRKVTLYMTAARICLLGTNLLAQRLPMDPASLIGARPQPRNALEDFSGAVQQLVGQVTPAVWQVVTEGFGGTEGESDGSTKTVSRQTGVASCVAVSADGDLITNAHVLNGVRRVRVRLDGTLVDVEIVGVDRETDLALLKLARGTPQHLELADSTLLRQGQVVFAVGSPQALNSSVSMGVV